MATRTTPREDDAPTRHADYRPHLDGLRAIAVFLVVAFHAEIARMSGGFIGVDVFFVLSGYLVTQLLLRDLGSYERIRLRRFYARRYRRLLPAAFVALVVSAGAYVLVASAAEVSDSKSAFRAAFLYVANWHFINQGSDYFASDINRSPVIHFWSLAVEEQFYLLWPLLLGGLFAASKRMGTRQVTLVRAVVALGALASVIAALHISNTNLNRAYYGTDTRAYQLLAGALLALTPRLFVLGERVRKLLEPVAVLALAAILALATSTIHIKTIHRGVAVTLAACVLIIAIESARTSLVARALSQPVAAYLGRLSYGIYLWHWPVIFVLTRKTSLGPVAVFVVTCVVATALAATSYHGLELGIRRSPRLDRYPLQVIAVGLTLSILGGLVVVPAVLNTKHASALSINGVDPTTLDWRAAARDIVKPPDCTPENIKSCTIVHGTGAHILLLGDSNAMMYIPTFTAIAKGDNLTLSVAVYPLCPWQQDLFFLIGVNPCKQRKVPWYGGVIDKLDPDVIFVADRPIDDPAYPTAVFTSGASFKPTAPGFLPAFQRATTQSLVRLEKPGRKIVIIQPIPIARVKDDPLECLSSATSVDQCIYQANAAPTAVERLYDRDARPGVVSTLDLDRVVCPRLPKCDPVVNGIIVKRDTDHITATFAAAIAVQVDAALHRDGVLGSG